MRKPVITTTTFTSGADAVSSGLRDTFGPSGEGPDFSIWRGIIRTDATHPDDVLEVEVPNYAKDQLFGPCHFAPRATLAGGPPLLPGWGDPCTVAFDEEGNAEIMTWWTEDPT